MKLANLFKHGLRDKAVSSTAFSSKAICAALEMLFPDCEYGNFALPFWSRCRSGILTRPSEENVVSTTPSEEAIRCGRTIIQVTHLLFMFLCGTSGSNSRSIATCCCFQKYHSSLYDKYSIEDEEDLDPMTLELEDDNDVEEVHCKNQESAQVDLYNLAGSFSTMAVSNISSNTKKGLCIDVQLPNFLYSYIKKECNYCSVNFLVMPVPKEMLHPKLAPGGMVLQLGIVIPP